MFGFVFGRGVHVYVCVHMCAHMLMQETHAYV